MNKIVLILVVALIIAAILALGVYHYFGDGTGYFFSLFIAVPAGLAGAGALYLNHDSTAV